jgi:hypothetical protein
MDWKGETFYSGNAVKQLKDDLGPRTFAFTNQPGREWLLVEQNRLGMLRGAIAPDKRITLIDQDLNNKFVLVTVE